MLNGWNVPLSGLQLGYTVVFGSYASFLFIQTGRWLLTLLCIIAIISLVHNIGFSRYLYYKIVHYHVCVRQAFSFPSFFMRYFFLCSWYMLYLFLAGHFLAPVVAHVFCNIMGLPVLVSPGKGMGTKCLVTKCILPTQKTMHTWETIACMHRYWPSCVFSSS